MMQHIDTPWRSMASCGSWTPMTSREFASWCYSYRKNRFGDLYAVDGCYPAHGEYVRGGQEIRGTQEAVPVRSVGQPPMSVPEDGHRIQQGCNPRRGSKRSCLSRRNTCKCFSPRSGRSSNGLAPAKTDNWRLRARSADQSYDVDIICAGAADDDGRPVPLGGGVLPHKLRVAHVDLSLFEEAPPDTDLENDCKHGPGSESTDDSSVWARTSLEALLDLIGEVPVHLAAAVRYKLTRARPGHVVVFGPDGFHLCSCLKLLRHGLLCRHYFAVLVRFLGGKFRGLLLNHHFNGNNVHTRWRRSLDGNDESWSVSRVLNEAGHGDGWDGCDEGQEDNFWGPTFDEHDGEDGVHPAKRAAKAVADRSASDQRRVYASMMAKNKENVSEILRTVSHAKAMEIQSELDTWVRFQLEEATGDNKTKNPAQVQKPGRPKKFKSGGQKQQRGNDDGAPAQTGSAKPVGNP